MYKRQVLSRSIAELGIYPAVDPLESTSRALDPEIVGQEHYDEMCIRDRHGGVDQGKVGDRSDGRADGLRFSAPAQIFPDQGRKPPPRSFHRSPQKLVELVSFCEQDVIIGNGLHWV